jgi:two-component system, OmpR family, response regulator ResD
MPQTILVVDDEPTVREVIRRYLERDGYLVREAADGQTALAELEHNTPDLIVLDLMLPKLDGMALTQQVRQTKTVPIIMLTARGETTDRIHGLDVGADDYVTKPFSPQELVSRIRAVLRRSADEAAVPHQPAIEFNGLKIDPATRLVTARGSEITLTAKEFDLLWFLARHPRQVFTRSQLLDYVWGYEFEGDSSTITVNIRRLREKIERDPSNPDRILTVWGVGYKFESEV